jgi:probable phosphoglycerate mutase
MRHLIIVRHGNTFRPGETPTRVGARTDLPLVEEERARKAGRLLRSLDCLPDRVFAAPLQRTMRTAELLLHELGLKLTVRPAPAFTEIDHGPDENQPEERVLLRLGRRCLERSGITLFSEEEARRRGEQIIRLWDAEAIPPPGWRVDATALVAGWKAFAAGIGPGEKVLMVSSGGVIRFAPHLLPQARRLLFSQRHGITAATGGVCIFARDAGDWDCPHWNLRADGL